MVTSFANWNSVRYGYVHGRLWSEKDSGWYSNCKLRKSSGGINWSAVAYYNHLIDMLVLHDITLFVTLFHYDLPQDLQNQYDGWLGMEFLFVYHIEFSIHIISSDCFFFNFQQKIPIIRWQDCRGLWGLCQNLLYFVRWQSKILDHNEWTCTCCWSRLW